MLLLHKTAYPVGYAVLLSYSVFCDFFVKDITHSRGDFFLQFIVQYVIINVRYVVFP